MTKEQTKQRGRQASLYLYITDIKQLEAMAAKEESSVSRLVRLALHDFFRKHDKQPAPAGTGNQSGV